MNTKIHILILLIFLIPNLTWGHEKCISLSKLSSDGVFPKNGGARTLCKLIYEIESFRTKFINKFGKANWKKFKYMKSSPDEYGGVSLTIYDVHINEIIDASSALNSSAHRFPSSIEKIKINDTYTFIKKEKKWLYSDPMLNIRNPSPQEINNYIEVIIDAKNKITSQDSPYQVMKLIHDGITNPITNTLFSP